MQKRQEALRNQANRVCVDNVSEADLGSFPTFDRATLNQDEQTLFGGKSPAPEPTRMREVSEATRSIMISGAGLASDAVAWCSAIQ